MSASLAESTPAANLTKQPESPTSIDSARTTPKSPQNAPTVDPRGPISVKKIAKIFEVLELSDAEIVNGDPVMFTAIKHFSVEITNCVQYDKSVLKVVFPKLAVFKGAPPKTYKIDRSWPIKRFILQILKTFNLKNWQRYYLETSKGYQFDSSQTFGALGFGSVFPGLQVYLKRRPLKKKVAAAASPAKGAKKIDDAASKSSSSGKLSSLPNTPTKPPSKDAVDSPSSSRSSRRSVVDESKSSKSSSSSSSRRRSERRPGDDERGKTKEGGQSSRDLADKVRSPSSSRSSKRASIAITSPLKLDEAAKEESARDRHSSRHKDKPQDKESSRDKERSKDKSNSSKDGRDKSRSHSGREEAKSPVSESSKSRSKREMNHTEEPPKSTSTGSAVLLKKPLAGSGLVITKMKKPTPNAAEKPPSLASAAKKTSTTVSSKPKKSKKSASAKRPILFVLPKDFKQRLQRVTLSPGLSVQTVATMLCERLGPKDGTVSAKNVLMKPLLVPDPLHPSASFSTYGFGKKFQKWELQLVASDADSVSKLAAEPYAPHFGWINMPDSLPALSLPEAKGIIIKLDRQLFSKSDAVVSNRLKNLEKELASSTKELTSLKKYVADVKKDRDRYRKERDEARSTLNKIVESSKGSDKNQAQVVATIQLEAEIKRLNAIIAEMTNDQFAAVSESQSLRRKLEDLEESHKVAMFRMRMEYADQLEKLEEQIEYLLGRNEWIAEEYKSLRSEADEVLGKLEQAEAEKSILAEEVERLKSLPVAAAPSGPSEDEADSSSSSAPAPPPPPPPPPPPAPPGPSASKDASVPPPPGPPPPPTSTPKSGGGFVLPAPGEFPKLRTVTAEEKARPAPAASSADAIISELRNFKLTSLKATEETHVAQKLERKMSFRSALASEISNFSRGNLRKAAVENAAKKRKEDTSEFAVALKKRFASIMTEDEPVEELDDDWDDDDETANSKTTADTDEPDEDEDDTEETSTTGDHSSNADLDDEESIDDELEIGEADRPEDQDEDEDPDEDEDEDEDFEDDLEDDYYYDDFHL